MLQLKKPPRLHRGDKVATVSLSWGAAGSPDIRWRYELGKRRMETLFGLQVVEMPHTLAPERYVSEHPEKRAEDLMAAFADDSIRAIFGVIGGNDSIGMLPYLDFELIRSHPKILTGYSDGTVSDFICMKAGLRSFYGAHVLNDFGEPGQMPPYTVRQVETLLFSGQTVGRVDACNMTGSRCRCWRSWAFPISRWSPTPPLATTVRRASFPSAPWRSWTATMAASPFWRLRWNKRDSLAKGRGNIYDPLYRQKNWRPAGKGKRFPANKNTPSAQARLCGGLAL